MRKLLVLLTIVATAFGTSLSAEENTAFEQPTEQLLAQNGYDDSYTYPAPGAGTSAGMNIIPFVIGVGVLAAIAGIIVAATDDSSSTSHIHS